jgi:large exoprotein involved in heme utilization and adhesion
VWTSAGARADTTSTGAGGEIHIDAGDLTIRNDTAVSARTLGSEATGEAGAIGITARHLEVDGTEGLSFISAASAHGPGSPGRVDVVAGSIELLDLAFIRSSCDSCTSKAIDRRAGAATVEIRADSLVARGSGAPEDFVPGVYANSIGGNGDAGTIILTVPSLQLLEGGAVGVHAGDGQGNNAGSLTITADSIFMSGRSRWASAITAANGGTSGQGGTISITTRTLDVERGAGINAENSGAGKGGTIDILGADSIVIESGGLINAQSSGGGDAGTINIRDADSIVIGSGASIKANSRGGGSGGDITLDAENVSLTPGGDIQAVSLFGGNGGTIRVTATDSIVLDHGENGAAFSLLGILGYIVNGSGGSDLTGIFSSTIGGGRGGDVLLDAPEIAIKNGAFIASSTVGGGAAGSIELSGRNIHLESGGWVDTTSLPLVFGALALPGGKAGDVTLTAEDRIEVRGRRPVTLGAYEEWSHVSSTTLGSGAPGKVTLDASRIVVDGGAVATTAVAAGNGWEGSAGGNISLETEELLVKGGGRVDASSFIAGPGGTVHVVAGRSILVQGAESGIASRTGAEGPGGNLTLHAPRIEVKDGAEISAESAPAEQDLGDVGDIFASLLKDGLIRAPDPEKAKGPAGSIELAAERLLLYGGTIAINSARADGGKVTIAAQKLLHLDAGVINASVNGGLETTGGNITIDPEVVLLENGSSIVATAAGGHGGRIEIVADNYFAFPDSNVSASAEGGPEFSGIVAVHAPDVDLAGNLTELPTTYLDAASLMRERCAARRSDSAGSFAVLGNSGIPPEPDGWLRAPVVINTEETADASPELPLLAASLPGPLLAAGTCE